MIRTCPARGRQQLLWRSGASREPRERAVAAAVLRAPAGAAQRAPVCAAMYESWEGLCLAFVLLCSFCGICSMCLCERECCLGKTFGLSAPLSGWLCVVWCRVFPSLKVSIPLSVAAQQSARRWFALSVPSVWARCEGLVRFHDVYRQSVDHSSENARLWLPSPRGDVWGSSCLVAHTVVAPRGSALVCASFRYTPRVLFRRGGLPRVLSQSEQLSTAARAPSIDSFRRAFVYVRLSYLFSLPLEGFVYPRTRVRACLSGARAFLIARAFVLLGALRRVGEQPG